jgi:hypothetical protein
MSRLERTMQVDGFARPRPRPSVRPENDDGKPGAEQAEIVSTMSG